MSIDHVSPARMDPREFARLVKRTPRHELERLMQSERRGVVLDELVAGMVSVFRPEVAGSTEAVVHWHIAGRPDGEVDVYELVIADRRCVLSPAPQRPPRLTLALSGVDFIHLVTGNAHPVILVMRGAMKIKGDKLLSAKFPNLFANPKP